MTSWTKFGKEEKVGLIGCGRMGCCMLQSMRDAGYQVVAYDAFSQPMERARQLGAEIVQTSKAVAEAATVVLLSLPGPAQLEEVLFGNEGIASALGERHIVVDTSTVDPTSTRNNATRVKEMSGAEYLDSPILGRPSASGKWMLPTGGNADALARVEPVLLTFASAVRIVGKSGAGNALKLLNQMMFSCINAISSEVMAICEHVGIDREVFYSTIAGSSAATVSGLFREVGGNIVKHQFDDPPFTVDLLIKDAKLALQMAMDSGAPSVIAGAVQIYNELAHAAGLGGQDTSALYKVFSEHFKQLS